MAQMKEVTDDFRRVTVHTELSLQASPEIESLPNTLYSPTSPSHSVHRRTFSGGSLNDHLLHGHERTESGSQPGRDSGDLKPQTQHNLARTYLVHPCFEHWWWELLCMAFSIGCMAAITIVLLTTEGKSLSEWHIPISPNTVVAIFSTFAKSSMLLVVTECISQLKWIYFHQQGHYVADLELFDSASRGPLGSLKLLWRINWRATLSSSCAMLILIAMAMDPFAQEILGYSAHDVPLQNGTASLRFAREWKSNITYQTSNREFLRKQIHEELDIYQVLSGADRRADFQCSTGNCTWQEYPSLGVCCDCADVTEASKIERRITAIKYGVHYRLDWKFSTPRGFELFIPVDFDFRGRGRIGIDLIASVARLPDNTEPLSAIPSAYRLPELAVGRYSFNDKFLNGLPTQLSQLDVTNIPAPQVHECRFYYCEKIRSAKVRNGNLQESVGNKSALLDFHTSRCGPDECGYAKSPDGSNETYVVGRGNSYILARKFLQYFNSPPQRALKEGVTALDPEEAELWWANNGNIPSTMDDIAEGVSEIMRRGPSSEWLRGKAYGPVTIIRVQWAWLALPIVVLLLAAVLLSILIMISMEGAQVVWKSSLLALLFHGLSGWTQADLCDTSMDAMEKKAQTMSAKLNEDKNGIVMLVRTEET